MRDKLIDVARGIGILLVVFAHIYEGIATNIIYLFHMPLFFYLSGATFSFSNSNFNRLFVNKRIKTLLVPYLFFSLISFLYWWLIESHFRPIPYNPIFDGKIGELSILLQQFINIFLSIAAGSAFVYNSPLWFLTCLFVSVVSYSIIKKFFGKLSFIICCLSAAFYFIMGEQTPHLPWCFEIALTTLPLLCLGDVTYNKLRSISFKNSFFVLVISFIVSVAIISFCHPSVNMFEHDMPIWWQFYLCSLSLIIMVVLFGKLVLQIDNGILQWLGKNSLIIMCIHGPIYRIVLYAISFLFKEDVSSIRHSLFMSSSVVLLVVFVAIPICIVINKYFPFVLGKKKINS